MSILFSLDLHPPKTRRADTGFTPNVLTFQGTNNSTVILVHGLTGTPNEMKFLASFLNRNGYSVICPPLANHGKPLRVLKKTRWEEFYASLRDVARSVVQSSDGPVFVAGLSMGSLLALLLADEFKESVCGISCLAPTLFYDGWNTPWSSCLLPAVYKTPLRHFFYFKEEPPYGIKNEIIQQRIYKYYQSAHLDDIDDAAQYGYPFFPIALLQQLELLVKHLRKRLPYIQAPLQLMQAKDDDVASVKNSKCIYDNAGSAIKEMVLLYDSYHVITADCERHIVAEKVLDFFNRQRGL